MNDFDAPRKIIQYFRVIDFIVLIAIAFLLYIKYRDSKDKAYLWLGIPLFVWPVFTFGLDPVVRNLIDRSAMRDGIRIIPFLWMVQGRATIGDVVMALNSLDRFVFASLVLGTLFVIFRKNTLAKS